MSKVKKIAANTGMTIALPLAIYLIFVVITHLVPGAIPFGSLSLLVTILQNSVLGILVALALCVNMPTGRIDLSAGSVVILTAIVCSRLALENDLSIWIMLLMCTAMAVLLATITGLSYVALRLPAMIVSLGMVIIYESITGIVFDGQGVTALERSVRLFGYTPYCFIVVVLAMLIFHIITEHTVFAYSSRLLSYGQAMAVKMGVREKKNAVMSFALSGFFLGVAATVYVSNYGLVEAAGNMSSAAVMFDSMLPVMIGMALARFSCRAIGVSAAVISMKMISYGLFCLGFNAAVQNVVSGTFIVVLVITTGWLSMKPELNRVRRRAEALCGETSLGGPLGG